MQDDLGGLVMKRMLTCCTTLLASLILFPVQATRAQQPVYPNKPIRLIIPYTAGGGTDITARLYADKLSTELGQPIVVENKPGASGRIAADLVKNAPPDGYTLLWGTSALLVVAPLVDKDPTFNPVENFSVIGFTTTFDLVLGVPANSPFNTVGDLVGELRKGTRITYGSSGVSTPVHLAGGALNSVAGGRAQVIQYNGTAPTLQDLIGGRLTYGFATAGEIAKYIDSGQLKGLATLSTERIKKLPNIPTLAESNLLEMAKYSWDFWQAVVGLRTLPKPVIERLNAAVTKVSADPDLLAKLDSMSLRAMPQMSPGEADARVNEDVQSIGEILNLIGK
jgi:tripartite-type tricarboxylate transporter receptor subunit TctC